MAVQIHGIGGINDDDATFSSHCADRVRVKTAHRGRERDKTDEAARDEVDGAGAEVPAFAVINIECRHVVKAVSWRASLAPSR